MNHLVHYNVVHQEFIISGYVQKFVSYLVLFLKTINQQWWEWNLEDTDYQLELRSDIVILIMIWSTITINNHGNIFIFIAVCQDVNDMIEHPDQIICMHLT